ncbi:MAG: peptide/nickel transport system permease protein, partial [Eubacteriaceae bacterium]|nr:peptide/nickel transport system permease protein [Eubacteriaceae bacterium]
MEMIFRRLFLGIFIMIVASLLSFVLLYMAPGNPAENILRQRTGEDPSYEEIELFLQQRDLDVPLLTQTGEWLYMALRFDFGESINTSEPVMDEFFTRFKATLQLTIITLAFSIPLAFFIGVSSAAKNGGAFDHVSRFFTLLAMSIPEFWLGLMLMIVFSKTLNWLPSFGYGSYL